MAKIEITLPDSLNDFVAARVEAGRYADASSYLRDLLEHEQERQQALAAVRRRIDDARASGVSSQRIPDILDEVEQRLRRDGVL